MSGRRGFRPGWPMTVFVGLALPVVVGLGFWQLDRAHDKRDLDARYVARLGMPALAAGAALESPASSGASSADFMRVRLRGRFEAGHDYLVDNRVHQGRPGYWVVSRFRGRDDRIYLVNRGWVEAPATRQSLPEIETPRQPLDLVGVIWPDLGLPPLLAEDPWPAGWPRRVQRLDIARMAESEGVVPAEIRLEPGQPGVFVPAPLDVNFRPERHTGYAVQWFGLGAVLVVGYVVFGRRRARERLADDADGRRGTHE